MLTTAYVDNMITEITVRLDLSKLATQVNDEIEDDNKKESPESLKRYLDQNPHVAAEAIFAWLVDQLGE